MSSYSTPFLGKTIRVHVDRPIGSKHPKHDWTYPVNYWYVPDIMAPDWEELDAYILGVSEAVATFTGCCIAIIHRTDDDDDKLVVVPDGLSLTDAEIRDRVDFQERFFQSEIIR